jgi:hypothetical protein
MLHTWYKVSPAMICLYYLKLRNVREVAEEQGGSNATKAVMHFLHH